jgi:hypothetical protein
MASCALHEHGQGFLFGDQGSEAGLALIVIAASGDPLLDWLVNNASAVGVLSFVVVALLRGWLVTGRENQRIITECDLDAKRLIAERDRALDLVYAQAEATSRALAIAETKGKR